MLAVVNPSILLLTFVEAFVEEQNLIKRLVFGDQLTNIFMEMFSKSSRLIIKIKVLPTFLFHIYVNVMRADVSTKDKMLR